MAKSLFGGNNGGNLQDKYRAQNDAAIKRERADELDGKISQLSEAKKSDAWAEEVIVFYNETLPFNEDISDLLVNLSLIERLKKEADAYIARQKEKEAEALRKKEAAELAKKRAAEEKKLADAAAKAKAELDQLKELDDTVLALSKASKNEYWIKDVKKLQKDISALTVVQRSKLKNLTLLQELCDKADSAEKAIPVEKSIAKVLAKKTATKKWYAEVIALYEETDASLKSFVSNYAELEKAARDAKSALKKIEDDEAAAKKQAAAAAKKAREEEKAREEAAKKARLQKESEEVDEIRERLKKCKKGKTVFFGEYRSSTSRETTPIEWIVLYRDEYRAYLITKDVIEKRSFGYIDELYKEAPLTYYAYGKDSRFSKFTWKNSDLRQWLNGQFLNSAFSSSEQRFLIEETRNSYCMHVVDNGNDPYYDKAITSEKVFIPGVEDLNAPKLKKLLNNKKFRRAKRAPYLTGFMQGEGRGFNKKYVAWWLRDTNTESRYHQPMVNGMPIVAPYGTYPVRTDFYCGVYDGNDKNMSYLLMSDNVPYDGDRRKSNEIAAQVGVRPMIIVDLETRV